MTTHSSKEYNDDNPWRDEGTLRELYWEDGLTVSDIADEFDITHQAVLYWFDKHGIERRPPEARKQLHASYTHFRGHPVWRDDASGNDVRFPVHRLVAISEHGAEAVSGMVVHHSNHIPWDNRPSNLELMEPGEHIAHHSREHHGDSTEE